MKKLDNNIWVVEAPFKLFGAEFGNRMTIVRLSGGELLLHSPIEISNRLLDFIEPLGKVAFIITPNNFHGLYVDAWRKQFPHAKYFTAKGVVKNDASTYSLDTLKNADLGMEIEIIKLEGAPKVNEYAFIHKQSKSLILTDIAFNISADVSLWSRIFFKLNGALNQFGPSRLMKTMVNDPVSLRNSVEKILAFDIERIIVSHGHILQSNAKESLRKAFCNLHPTPPRKSAARFSFSQCG